MFNIPNYLFSSRNRDKEINVKTIKKVVEAKVARTIISEAIKVSTSHSPMVDGAPARPCIGNKGRDFFDCF